MPRLLNKQERKIVTLASLGGMLEFYDFIIYGIFSVYFASQFFSSDNTLIVIIQSYLVFVLGYIARPVGGIIFSHIGDEYGEKTVLIITIYLMGIASVGIGILPTYSQIGLAAPLLLMTFRLLQGLALGGELPSTYVYIYESLVTKRGFAFGITMAFVTGGLLLGMLINYGLTHVLTNEQLRSFGWRLPFIFGGLVCLISYQIRKSLHQTNIFKKERNRPQFPVIFLLKHHFMRFIAGTCIIAVMSGFVVVLGIFMPTYLYEIIKVDYHTISYLMTLLMIVNTVTIYFTGKIAQKISPFKILKFILLFSCFLLPLGFLLIRYQHLILGIFIFGLLHGMSVMITPFVITSIFESKIRLSGVALCYNLGFTIFGGLAPLIITDSIYHGMGIYLSPCLYLLVMVVVCAVGLKWLKKYP